MKTHKQTSAIIFDFDGTLSDSLPLFLSAYNKIRRRKRKRPLTTAAFRRIGLPKLAQKEHLSRWQLFWVVIYARIYAERHKKEFLPFAGIETQIHKLSKKYTLGIVTSNSARNVRFFLAQHRLEDCFSFIESNLGYEGKDKKIKKVVDHYKIPLETTLYIGDERRDIEAAHRVGIAAVAVTWGFENKVLVSQAQPDLIISKHTNLYKSLSKFLAHYH